MYAKKVDVNQDEIVRALRKLGASVFPLHDVGRGCPDLLCGLHGATFLVEVKRDKRATFTKAQVEFMLKWKGGDIFRIENVDQAIEAVDKVKKSIKPPKPAKQPPRDEKVYLYEI